MLKRRLRSSEDSFLQFLRLGAKCWQKTAPPELQVTLAQESPEELELRLGREEENARKALVDKRKRATSLAARQAVRQALITAVKARSSLSHPPQPSPSQSPQPGPSSSPLKKSSRGRNLKRKIPFDL
jgi:hypothetical protein